MKKSIVWLLVAAMFSVMIAGCAGDADSKATEQEKSNIDRFVREGIKEGDMGGGGAPKEKVPEGLPGNQPVDQTP